MNGTAQEQKIRRHALLVGIDAYPEFTEWPALEGPSADVAAIKSVLIERGGFEEQTIRTLIDEQATKKAILGGLDDLIERAAPNDVLLFFFAGHGSWANDVDGDEVQDAADETLVPYDANRRSGENRDILDDDIRNFIAKANAKTPNVVLIFDCCCSGTAVRGSGIVSRQVPGPELRGIAGVREGTGKVEATMSFSNPFADLAESPKAIDETPTLDYVALAACRANESAAEMRVTDEATTRRGLFTYTLVNSLRDAKPGMTYSELMDEVSLTVRNRYARQHPALEGSLRHQSLFAGGVPMNRSFFSLALNDEGRPDIVARGAGDSSVTLRAGRIHGLAPGDRLQVCPSGTLAPGGDAVVLGVLELKTVRTGTSTATWVGDAPKPSSLRAARVFIWQRAQRHHSFAVTYEAASGKVPDQALALLLQAAKRLPDIKLTDSPEGNYTLRYENNHWQLLDHVGDKLPIRGRADDEGEVHDLLYRLDHLGHAAQLNQRTRNPQADGIQFEATFGLEAAAASDAEAGVVNIDTKNAVIASLTNTNDFPIYATLILFSPDGDIHVAGTCETPEDAIPPGGTKRIPDWQIWAPAEVAPFYRNQTCTLRWIVSRQWQDMRKLTQGPVTSTTRSGGGQQKAETVANSVGGSPLEQWATADMECRLLVTEPAGDH